MKYPITKYLTVDNHPIYALTSYWYVSENGLQEVFFVKKKTGQIKIIIKRSEYDAVPWGNHYMHVYYNKLAAANFRFDQVQSQLNKLNKEMVELLTTLSLDQFDSNLYRGKDE